MKHARTVGALSLAATLALSACGGDDSDDTADVATSVRESTPTTEAVVETTEAPATTDPVATTELATTTTEPATTTTLPSTIPVPTTPLQGGLFAVDVGLAPLEGAEGVEIVETAGFPDPAAGLIDYGYDQVTSFPVINNGSLVLVAGNYSSGAVAGLLGRYSLEAQYAGLGAADSKAAALESIIASLGIDPSAYTRTDDNASDSTSEYVAAVFFKNDFQAAIPEWEVLVRSHVDLEGVLTVRIERTESTLVVGTTYPIAPRLTTDHAVEIAAATQAGFDAPFASFFQAGINSFGGSGINQSYLAFHKAEAAEPAATAICSALGYVAAPGTTAGEFSCAGPEATTPGSTSVSVRVAPAPFLDGISEATINFSTF